jgi:hypothetical protein
LDEHVRQIEKDKVDAAWARAFYATAIPFNVIDNEWIRAAVNLTQRHVKQLPRGQIYSLP